MKQNLHFVIRKKGGKSIVIKGEFHFQKNDTVKVILRANKKSLKEIAGSVRTKLVQQLLRTGKASFKTKLSKNYENAILLQIRKAFGIKYAVSKKQSAKPAGGTRKQAIKKVTKKASKSKGQIKRKPAPSKNTVKKKSSKKSAGSGGLGGFSGFESIEYSISNKSVYTINILNESPPRASANVNDSPKIVTVLFATDRKKTNSAKPNEVYGNERNENNTLEYGSCEVNIPPDHLVGQIERPGWWRNTFASSPEDPQKDLMLLSLTSKSQADFMDELSAKIGTSTNHDAFIFIHGFNVNFDDAIRRTAQIAFDLNFKGVPITYSWPSKGTLKGYFSDEDSVRWTVPHLKGFIKQVLGTAGISKLHLIAHSMGNRALTDAIKELHAENFDLSKINQVVLAAPDIDLQVFTDVIVPGIKGIANQITLYASSKDKALLASKKVHASIIRAGESGKNIVIMEGISTVDASEVKTDLLGHGYFAENRELINDIFLMFEYAFTPPKRNLTEKRIPPRGEYWLFPASRSYLL